MSPIPIINELESLIRKYEDVCTPLDLLRMIGSVAKLEEANILLHDRMKRDVFSLFGKSEDGTMLSNTGSRLMLLSRVTKYHTAHSCNQFHVDATVEFAESNAFTNKKAETDNNGKMSSGKRRRDEPAPTLVLHEPVYLQYLFTEQTVGTGSGTGDVRREKGVSVMESPYKSINLTITMCRGAGGVDKATLLDFQLLTAGCSPSDQQISLQDLMDGQQMQDDDEGSINDENEESDKCSNDGSEGDGDEGGAAGPVDGCGGEGESGGEDDADSAAGGSDSDSRTDSKEGLETGEEGGEGEEGEEGELEEDTADYYNVNVSSEALAQVSYPYLCV